MRTFIDKVIAGIVSPTEIEEYVDSWHRTESDVEVHEFLGMTEDEYNEWMNDPSRLDEIIESYRAKARHG